MAVVLSNDTDLIEPMRIATQELGKIVGLLSPVANPATQLKVVASFVRHIKVSDLVASQLPDPIVLANGTVLPKPASWV